LFHVILSISPDIILIARKGVLFDMKILLLLIWLSLLGPHLYAQPPLYIGSAFEPPVSTPAQQGIVDQIVLEAFARLGREAVITHLPAERSLLSASSGINDGDLIRVDGLQNDYPDLVQVHESLINFEFVAFSKNSQIKMNDWEDLSGYSVGIVRGWKILEEKAVHSRLTKVDSLELLFPLLEKGRADLVIYERLAGLHAIQTMQLQDIFQAALPLKVQPMYLYLHRVHSDLVGPLVTVLKAMKQDGTFQGIFANRLSTLAVGEAQ
jgi:polar amino acid transport system substrate-binding protein